MNNTIETIMNHRSIRKFKNDLLTTEQVHTIVKAAQMGSSSSNMQPYSIIGISDPEKKKKIREQCGQMFAEENGYLFVFCADTYRFSVMGGDVDAEKVEMVLPRTLFYHLALVDTAIAAQNAAIAAESMGFGVVYFASILAKFDELNELLGLPKYVMPLFGMAVGVPADNPEVKPRLPMELVFHENEYNSDPQFVREQIANYEEEIKKNYQARDDNKPVRTWLDTFMKMFNVPEEFLSKSSEMGKQKGFNVQ